VIDRALYVSALVTGWLALALITGLIGHELLNPLSCPDVTMQWRWP